MPPATPTYDQANASLGTTYDPQVQALQAQNPQIDQQLTTTLSSLDQAKVNAFRDITNSANSKGMLFSGFSPDQQATYTGTKYLPAVANARTSAQNAKNTLLDRINTINTNRQNQARGIVSTAQTAAQNYSLKQQQIAASRVSSSGGGSSSGRSSSGSSGGSAPTAAQLKQQDMATTSNNLQSKIGKDNHVSQATWNQAFSEWTGAGYSAKDFINDNIRFVNQRYNGYQGIGKQNAIGTWG